MCVSTACQVYYSQLQFEPACTKLSLLEISKLAGLLENILESLAGPEVILCELSLHII